MRTSLFALGFLAIGLARCSGDKGVFVGEERGGSAGESGDTNQTGGASTTGGAGGSASGTAGTAERGGTDSVGGTESRGGSGSGAEGGEGAEPGTGGTSTGGGEQGGSNTGGLGGDVVRGGAGGMGAEAGSGTAARGGANDGGRAGTSNAGTGGRPTDTDCTALAKEYQDRLALAQQCLGVSTTECSLEMPDDLLCGCPTYVNPARDADIRRMNELIEKARNCVRICPAIACREVKSGRCSTDAIIPARGRCVAEP